MAKLTLRQLQSQLASAPARWRGWYTKMSELSQPEQERRLGLLVKEEEKARVETYLRQARAPRAIAFASASDWRSKNGKDWTTPIKDQGNCGSCVSFATVATIETQTRIQFNKPALASTSLRPSCSSAAPARNATRDGGRAMPWITPRRTASPKRRASPIKTTTWIVSMPRIAPTVWSRSSPIRKSIDVPARKEFLDKVGPMVACLAVYNDFMYYQSGVYEHRAGDLLGYHAVSCVGYDEAGQYWICKNSWSEDWGDKGYFKIAYGEAEIDTSFPAFGVSKVSTTLDIDDTTDDATDVGDDWAEMVFAEHSFGSKKNVLWAFVKGKWRYQEVTETELHGFGGTLFEAGSVRAFYKGEKLDKLVSVKKYRVRGEEGADHKSVEISESAIRSYAEASAQAQAAATHRGRARPPRRARSASR